MQPEQPTPHQPARQNPFLPGQTAIFVGDHTSPDEPGYVSIISSVLARFHPELQLTLISAGSRGQTAGGLKSRALLDIISSSKPDWLVIGVGLVDAMREPVARELLQNYRARRASDDEVEAIFGPEHIPHIHDAVPVSDLGSPPELRLERLNAFRADLGNAIGELQSAGVGLILMTVTPVGNDRDNPVNGVIRNYSKAIKELATEKGCPLVDVERTFRDMLDRAATYKQKVALAGSDGALNVQGQTLMARTFLDAFDLLPYPGFRPRR